MLYEIISPDAFLRPFIDDYATLLESSRGQRNAYTKKVYVDRAFQRKTNELVQKHVGHATSHHETVFEIDAETIEMIKNKNGRTARK